MVVSSILAHDDFFLYTIISKEYTKIHFND